MRRGRALFVGLALLVLSTGAASALTLPVPGSITKQTTTDFEGDSLNLSLGPFSLTADASAMLSFFYTTATGVSLMLDGSTLLSGASGSSMLLFPIAFLSHTGPHTITASGLGGVGGGALKFTLALTTAAVPLPPAIWMFLTGLAVLVGFGFARRVEG